MLTSSARHTSRIPNGHPMPASTTVRQCRSASAWRAQVYTSRSGLHSVAPSWMLETAYSTLRPLGASTAWLGCLLFSIPAQTGRIRILMSAVLSRTCLVALWARCGLGMHWKCRGWVRRRPPELNVVEGRWVRGLFTLFSYPDGDQQFASHGCGYT